MNRQFSLLLLIAAGLSAAPAAAQVAGTVKADNVVMERNGNLMKVDMDVNLSQLKVKSNRAVVVTPCIVSGSDTLALKSVSVYGRSRYYYQLRNDATSLTGDATTAYRASKAPTTVDYSTIVPYEEWMAGADLVFKTEERGCCNDLLAANTDNLGSYYAPATTVAAALPELLYVKADAEKEKELVLSGSAYVQFPVNQTVIYADYRDNTREISKIVGLLDTLRRESDVKISHVTLKGYASPEGSYTNNERLAKGRVAALKNYISNLYHFQDGIITTDYEPEDWEGFRAYVAASNLTERDALLRLIDSKLLPDDKEAQLRSRYPTSYAFLLQEVFPTLRHTDYTIRCQVKRYADPAEIAEILQRDPRLLSLNEIYVLANTYETGSEKFNDLYETAVRLYPDDAVANLNVANVAIRRGELDKADSYLAKAGDTPQAAYTRGVVAYLRGDKTTARSLLTTAAAQGVDAATTLLQQLQ